jgi:hypothetical protein
VGVWDSGYEGVAVACEGFVVGSGVGVASKRLKGTEGCGRHCCFELHNK